MSRILLTQDAEASRIAIWDYIALSSLTAADRWIDLIDEQRRLIATQPRTGIARPDLGLGVRSVPFRDYVIICRPIPDGIEVLLIVHGYRDIPAFFRQRFQT